jgi:hypothetical protein
MSELHMIPDRLLALDLVAVPVLVPLGCAVLTDVQLMDADGRRAPCGGRR